MGPDTLLQQLDGRTPVGWEESRWGSSFSPTPAEMLQHLNNWLNICASAKQLKVSLASGLWHVPPPVYLVISFLGAFASSSSHLECLISSVFQSLTQNHLPRAPQQFICISLVTLGTFYL